MVELQGFSYARPFERLEKYSEPGTAVNVYSSAT
jgi:hypothetical protein